MGFYPSNFLVASQLLISDFFQTRTCSKCRQSAGGFQRENLRARPRFFMLCGQSTLRPRDHHTTCTRETKPKIREGEGGEASSTLGTRTCRGLLLVWVTSPRRLPDSTQGRASLGRHVGLFSENKLQRHAAVRSFSTMSCLHGTNWRKKCVLHFAWFCSFRMYVQIAHCTLGEEGPVPWTFFLHFLHPMQKALKKLH